MAVAPVFAFAVPAPHNATLVNGEQALSVASPIGTAAPATNYRLARWFDFEGGVYTFRSVADNVATWMAAIELTNARVLFATALADGVVERTVFIPRGRKRLDVLLVNTDAVASSCYVAFSMWQNGRLIYASAPTGWVFDTTAVPDASVPDIGDRRLTFPLFPLLPNWAGGVTERLTWRTEILDSESDTEQRRSVRRYPRRSFEVSFLRQGPQRSRLDAFILGMGMRELLLPLWHEQFYLTGPLGATMTFPAGTGAMREFAAGTLVVAYDTPESYELLTVQSRVGDTITFTTAPTGTWTASHRVMPVRVARILESARFENQSDNVATAQVRFDLEEPETWPAPSWGAAQPVFAVEPNRASALSVDFTRKTFVLDSESGATDTLDVGDLARVGTRLQLLLRGRAAVHNFRAFIHNARGRAVRFWTPDFMQSVHLTTATLVGTTLDAKNVGLVRYAADHQDARRIIGIVLKDGSPTIYREVTRVEDLGATERMHLSTALPSIFASNVLRVQFMLPSRFDQDAFEFQHSASDSAVVQTTVVIRSTDRTGMTLT